MAAVHVKGSKVYVVDKEHAWVPAEVSAASATEVVAVTQSGTNVKLKPDQVAAYSDTADQGVDDMLELDILNTASILQNLRVRSKQDKFYTQVGSILVSVNPFKPLSIYGPDALDRVSSAPENAKLEPHIYGIAKNAYESMLRTSQNQAVVISGESGAGKTEATKYVLKYLTTVSGGADAGGQSKLEKMILQSNPVLEAFGNAKTVRNNNSSRFGKYQEVKFNRKGEIVGGAITNYLLEKSRVVTPAKDERNYHIFYQVCRGSSDSDKAKYKLADPDKFNYLSMSGCTSIPGVDDALEFADMSGALDVVGVTAEERDGVMRTLSAVLHLGNVEFEAGDDGDGAEIKSVDEVKVVAELLGCAEDTLTEALKVRTMSSGNARRNSVYKIPLKRKEAIDTRDALAKALYGRLFNWLVKKVSASLAPTAMALLETPTTIGVLDIFGFEVMPHNSFEQLCINYANEKLHQQFINFVLKNELEEYKKEGLDINIPFNDNAGVVACIEKTHGGVLSMLQEQVKLGQRGSDKAWLERMGMELGKDPAWGQPKLGNTDFFINHYAGQVKYDITNQLEKNKDALSQDIDGVLTGCMEKISNIMEEGNTISNTKAKVPTVSSQFKEQLTQLTNVLGSCNPHYIRCVKPTDLKQPGVYDGVKVCQQLNYSGVLETVQVRKAGFSVRVPLEDFCKRFRVVISLTAPPPTDPKPICDACKLGEDLWKKGKTKVLLKSERTLLQIESAREQAVVGCVIIIQKYARRHLTKKIIKALREEKRKREEEERKRREEEERRRREEEARLEAERLKKEAEEAKSAAEAAQKKKEAEEAARKAEMEKQNNEQKRQEEFKAQEEEKEKKEQATAQIAAPMLASIHKKRVMNPLEKPLAPKSSPSGSNAPIPTEPITFNGWMYKEGGKGLRGGTFHNWKKRFFQLKRGELTYYADDDRKDMKGNITLDANASVGEVPDDQLKKMPTKGVGEHFLQLCSKGRDLKMSVDKKQDKDTWISKISMTIKQIQVQEGKEVTEPTDGSSLPVHLPDKSVFNVKVTAATTAKEIFMKVIDAVGVTKGLQYFALVEENVTEEGVPTSRVCSESESMLAKAENSETSKLYFKKVVFVDRAAENLDNKVVLNFQYAQAVHEVLNHYHCGEEESLDLAALQLRISQGVLVPETHRPGWLLPIIHEFIPNHMLSKLNSLGKKWEEFILKKAFLLNPVSSEQCKQQYVQLTTVSPVYGSAFYHVARKAPDGKVARFILGVNSTGLHLLDAMTSTLLKSFPYEHIAKWGRSQSSFNIIQGEAQWTFETRQSEEINKFLGIYVRMLVERKWRDQAQAERRGSEMPAQ